MTSAQHIELQSIFRHFSTLQVEQIESAFAEQWEPFVLSLSTEDDRVEAFQMLYEWQIKQTDLLAQNLITLPTRKAGKKAA